jgi:hypothetical protein
LASWISDARAVEDSPALRRIESGAVVHVDDIRRALVALDELEPDRKGDGKRLRLSGRSRSVISRWLRRVDPLNGSNDNDDDPPLSPRRFRDSVSSHFVAAHGRAA